MKQGQKEDTLPENLRDRRYQRPDNYMGPDYFGMVSAGGRSRDSDELEESNFDETLKRLGGESKTVKVIRDSHWAVGWVETIYVSESDDKAIAELSNIVSELEAYPALNEEDWSEREYESLVKYLTEWHDIPENKTREVIERLNAMRPEDTSEDEINAAKKELGIR